MKLYATIAYVLLLLFVFFPRLSITICDFKSLSYHTIQRGTVPYRTWSHGHYTRTRTSISGPRRDDERIREVIFNP